MVDGLIERAVKPWLESGDPIMVEMANGLIEQNHVPDEEEAVCNLGCFLVFSYGCARLGLVDLSEKFSKRAQLYYLGLCRLGFEGGWIEHNRRYKVRGRLAIIVARACGMVKVKDDDTISVRLSRNLEGGEGKWIGIF